VLSLNFLSETFTSDDTSSFFLGNATFLNKTTISEFLNPQRKSTPFKEILNENNKVNSMTCPIPTRAHTKQFTYQ